MARYSLQLMKVCMAEFGSTYISDNKIFGTNTVACIYVFFSHEQSSSYCCSGGGRIKGGVFITLIKH